MLRHVRHSTRASRLLLQPSVRKYGCSAVLRDAEVGEAPKFDSARNPFKAKHSWPPNFDKLSDKQRFRLERRYRRRASLKWARPRLMVFTKLLQWGLCLGVVTYGVLFMDWGNDQAFKNIREWYKQKTSSIFSTRRPPPPPS